jgi:lauroyl/myristoyl acyltransferase
MMGLPAKAATHGLPQASTTSGTAVPWLQGRDLFVIVLMAVFWLASLCLPERRWFGLARWLAHRRLASSPKLSADELETVKVVVGEGEDKEAWIEGTFRRDWLAHKYLSWIQLLACYRPWRWQPRPELIGRKHLDEAIKRGRGVVLLTANFAYKDLMTKAALAKAGLWASHLARDSHGFAESRLGKALLNPIYVGIERRYLRDRLVFSGSDTKAVNKRIRAELQGNRPLLVTVTPLGRRTSRLPFLHGRIRIATGALNFACEADATVLPVFTIRKPDGRIETIIEHPLARPSGASHGEMIDAMLDDYVPRLETYVAQYPEQFSFPTSDRHGQALIEPKSASPSDRWETDRQTRPALADLTYRGEASP